MGDIKKITEEEIAKANPAKTQKTKISAQPPSPERKKKGKIQWKKLPMEEVGKAGQQSQSTQPNGNGKSSQPKKAGGQYNNSSWNGSGAKSSKSNFKGNDKGHGATKPWAGAGGSPNSKSAKPVALNVKGNAEKGKGSYLTATSGQTTQSNNKENNKKAGSDKTGQQQKNSNNSTKQGKKQKQSKPQQSKKDQTNNKDTSKANASGKKTVSAQASPYQPSAESQYGQDYDFQNNVGTGYNSYDQTGYGYDYNTGYYVPPPSLEETAAYAKGQIEYYFTTENLLRDMFLRAQFDDVGYVPISLLANFRAVYSVHQDYPSLVASLSESELLEVDTKHELVRLKDGWNHWLVPNGMGGFGQPSYAKAAAEAEAADSAKNAEKAVEEPQKESEPTDHLESSSVGSSDSDVMEATTKKIDDLKIESPPVAAAH